MAKRKSPVGQSECPVLGPSQGAGNGFDGAPFGPNPSDELFYGKPLQVIPAEAVTMRRDFYEPVRNPLHYLDGPGTDEVVTSRRFPLPQIQGQMHSRLDHMDYDEDCFGEDPNKYSQGSNEGMTTNGQPIRGT